MSSGLPARPRLARHAAARRHLVALSEVPGSALARYIVVHDTRAGGLVRLEEREWTILRQADGSRDVEGIRRAAELEGVHTSDLAIVAFLEELAAAGFVEGDVDGENDGAAPVVAHEPPIDRRPVVALPSFRLACDGRGSCCRLYATVLFSSEEEAKARAHCPDVLGGGADPRAAFTPEHGAAACGVHAAALVHGACAYLDDRHHCRIHAIGGPHAKPRGCLQFPAVFVDDGERIVVSPALECACVFASEGGTDGAPLVPDDVVDASGLDPHAFIHRLPAEVALRAGSEPVPLARALEWTSACRSAIASRPLLDALAGAATSLAAGELGDPARAMERAGDLDLGWPIRALADRLAERTRGDAAWRSASDLVRRTHAWMHDAVTAMSEPAVLAALWRSETDATERFYVDTILFGHHLFLEEVPLDAAVFDRIVRILLARAMRRVGPSSAEIEADGTSRYPLALVEAMMRGHGLVAYRSAPPEST